MKTETPPTQFTIADLWKELSKADYMERFKSDLVGCDHDWLVEKVASLRQQLVERCKPWISWNTDGSHYIEPRVVLYNATPNELRKVATVYEFAAWEIEQRQREKEAQP